MSANQDGSQSLRELHAACNRSAAQQRKRNSAFIKQYECGVRNHDLLEEPAELLDDALSAPSYLMRVSRDAKRRGMEMMRMAVMI